jgi:hypothetical protein
MYAFFPVACGSVRSANRSSDTKGGSAGFTVIESVWTSSRNSVAGSPFTVTSTMICLGALNNVTTVLNV